MAAQEEALYSNSSARRHTPVARVGHLAEVSHASLTANIQLDKFRSHNIYKRNSIYWQFDHSTNTSEVSTIH